MPQASYLEGGVGGGGVGGGTDVDVATVPVRLSKI